MNQVRRLAALTLAGLALGVAPARAQSVATESTDTTSTTTPPAAGSAPTTTAPDPGVGGDAPPESVPDVPLTVPPRDPDPGPGPGVSAPPGRVVTVSLRAARASALARQAAYADAVAHRMQVEQDLSRLKERVGTLASEARRAVLDLADARRELAARAVDAYVRGNGFDTRPIEPGPAAGADSQRATLLNAVVDRDRLAVARVRELQARVTSEQAQTAKQLNDAQSQLEQAQVDETQAQLDLTDAKLDLAVSSAGGNLVIHGFVFPVASPHSFTEDFGDPRLPDTPYAHVHQGCDVVAAEGTELYAAERGVITQVSDSMLGGNGVWLKGESGTAYYYAHLSAYADNLRIGQVVSAGDLVGFVGHTGDAYGPHLHFEVHPGGGSAVDPYPILLATDPQVRSP